MKTFKGNMRDYIYETPMTVRKIVENKKQLTAGFIKALRQQPIAKIWLSGAGTSNFSCQSVRHYIEKLCRIPTCVVLPTDFIDEEYLIAESGLMLGISATGTSASTINALRKAKELGFVTIACTNDLESSFAKENDYTVFIDHGEEDVSPKTKSYVSELVILMLCALEYAYDMHYIDEDFYTSQCKRLDATIDNIAMIIAEADKWYQANKEEFKHCERMLVVGYGNNQGTIKEGALKILECGRFQTSSYELEEFMHGIYHSIKDDCFLVYLCPTSKYQSRALQLRNYLSEFTSHQFIIGKTRVSDKDLVLPFIDDVDFNVIEYILPLQLIAYNIAIDKGINPNRPSDELFHKKMNSKYI